MESQPLLVHRAQGEHRTTFPLTYQIWFLCKCHLSICHFFQGCRKGDASLCDCSDDTTACLEEPTLDLNAGEKSHLISAELKSTAGIKTREAWTRSNVSHLLVWNANNAAVARVRMRDLASGRLLNGREQTAGAVEQTEQPHQKAEGVNGGWTADDEVRQSGHSPQLKGSGWWLLEPDV